MDTTITDKTKLLLLEGIVPLLEEARAIMGQWDGSVPGAQEQRSNICNDIFESAIKLQSSIKELEDL